MIEKQENLESHLTELRQRIIYSLVICLISLIIAFAFSSKTILQLQKLAPAGATFFQLRPGHIICFFENGKKVQKVEILFKGSSGSLNSHLFCFYIMIIRIIIITIYIIYIIYDDVGNIQNYIPMRFCIVFSFSTRFTS